MTQNEAWSILKELDSGKRRVAFPAPTGEWPVDETAKQAILTVFSEAPSQFQSLGAASFDKIPLKFQNWTARDFEQADIRVVPGAIVRYGAFIAPKAVLMNAFINIGAFIGPATMIDSFANIGSCAQIGERCHIASHVVIGGVLEPLNARPVIIEDGCFVGAHAAIVEGVHVHKNAVLGMGVRIGASTKIIDRATGDIFQGRVPENAVVVPGTYAPKGAECAQSCAIIVRYGASTHNTGINVDLRASKPQRTV